MKTRSWCGATLRTASARRCMSWSGGRPATLTRCWVQLPLMHGAWAAANLRIEWRWVPDHHCLSPLPRQRTCRFPAGGSSTKRSGTGIRRARCRRGRLGRRRSNEPGNRWIGCRPPCVSVVLPAPRKRIHSTPVPVDDSLHCALIHFISFARQPLGCVFVKRP